MRRQPATEPPHVRDRLSPHQIRDTHRGLTSAWTRGSLAMEAAMSIKKTSATKTRSRLEDLRRVPDQKEDLGHLDQAFELPDAPLGKQRLPLAGAACTRR